MPGAPSILLLVPKRKLGVFCGKRENKEKEQSLCSFESEFPRWFRTRLFSCNGANWETFHAIMQPMQHVSHSDRTHKCSFTRLTTLSYHTHSMQRKIRVCPSKTIDAEHDFFGVERIWVQLIFKEVGGSRKRREGQGCGGYTTKVVFGLHSIS